MQKYISLEDKAIFSIKELEEFYNKYWSNEFKTFEEYLNFLQESKNNPLVPIEKYIQSLKKQAINNLKFPEYNSELIVEIYRLKKQS